ncbi:hypothetical protein HDU84_001622 [Entophlyctis sp. JEL0112]|nr:hypothetical protein HDU84_001622 [Entophlyctis sp. JEL0112]
MFVLAHTSSLPSNAVISDALAFVVEAHYDSSTSPFVLRLRDFSQDQGVALKLFGDKPTLERLKRSIRVGDVLHVSEARVRHFAGVCSLTVSLDCVESVSSSLRVVSRMTTIDDDVDNDDNIASAAAPATCPPELVGRTRSLLAWSVKDPFLTALRMSERVGSTKRKRTRQERNQRKVADSPSNRTVVGRLLVISPKCVTIAELLEAQFARTETFALRILPTDDEGNVQAQLIDVMATRFMMETVLGLSLVMPASRGRGHGHEEHRWADRVRQRMHLISRHSREYAIVGGRLIGIQQ